MTSQWEQHQIEDKVVRLLREVEDESHHFGQPFLTAYQLAIEFDTRHHDVVAQLGLQVGGAGTGEHTSLAQYLARCLSGRIRSNPRYPIEGAFLSSQFVRELSYDHGSEVITSSLIGEGNNLSMFRIRRTIQ